MENHVPAHHRLETARAKRKLLFVMSDGAPSCDSTLSANPRNFLSKHLSAATGWIEQLGSVELWAIGLGKINPFYTNATQHEPEEIGVPIIDCILGK
jgi:cobaltochelatase CobT